MKQHVYFIVCQYTSGICNLSYRPVGNIGISPADIKIIENQAREKFNSENAVVTNIIRLADEDLPE